MARQWPSVHTGRVEAEMPQHGRSDVDQRGPTIIDARGKTAAGGEQKWSLLVGSEPAMLAEAGAVLRLERIADDVAVAGNIVRVGAVVGLQCHRDLRRRTGRQPDLGEPAADKYAADPVLI